MKETHILGKLIICVLAFTKLPFKLTSTWPTIYTFIACSKVIYLFIHLFITNSYFIRHLQLICCCLFPDLVRCVSPTSNWLVQSHERDNQEVNIGKKSLLEKLWLVSLSRWHIWQTEFIHHRYGWSVTQIHALQFSEQFPPFFPVSQDIVYLRWRKPTVNYTSSSFSWDHFAWDRQLSCVSLPRLCRNRKVLMVVGEISQLWNMMILMFFTSETLPLQNYRWKFLSSYWKSLDHFHVTSTQLVTSLRTWDCSRIFRLWICPSSRCTGVFSQLKIKNQHKMSHHCKAWSRSSRQDSLWTED